MRSLLPWVRAMSLAIATALPLCMRMQAAAQSSSEVPAAAQSQEASNQAKLTWQRFPHEFADYYCMKGIPVTYLDTHPEFPQSNNALLLDVRQSPFATTMVVDASGGADSPYDTLYVDLNCNGKYTDDPVYKAEPFKGECGPDRKPVLAYFPDVATPRPGIPDAKPRMQVFLGNDDATIIPAQWAVGSVTIAGRKMPVALVDTNWDGKVSAARGRTPGSAKDSVPRSDCLILGIDGENELRPPAAETLESLFVPGEGGSARGFLAKHLVLESGTYAVKVEQLDDGANLQLSPVQVPMGAVNLTKTPTRSHVLLMGQSTCVMWSGHPTELVVPADTYLFMNRTVSTNEFTVKQGEQTLVDPQEGEYRTQRPAASRPAATQTSAPASRQARSPKAASQPAINLLFRDFPSRFADGNCLQGLPRPVVLTGKNRPSFCKSGKPVLFDAHHSPIPTKILLDESRGNGTGYDVLYLDFNDNGDFLDDAVYKAVPYSGTMFPDSEPVVLYFRDVHVPRNLKQGRSAHVQIFIERLPGWPEDITALHPRIIPQRWAVGTVMLGGEKIPAAVIDRDWDDTFVTRQGLDANRKPPAIPRGDYLVLGLDGEKRLIPCDLDDYAGSARIVMNEHVAIDGQVYLVKAARGTEGVSLELVPVEMPHDLFTLPASTKVNRLILYATKVSAIIRQPSSQISLPRDTYYAPQLGPHAGQLLLAAQSQPANPGRGSSAK